ncbi:MAG: hypothetical protein H7328_05345 [Bdellovibrio sp.]|nr:hypothetical protein [Bdellovibrio sp.]
MKKYPAIFFSIKCGLIGGLVMFICMAAGELFVNPEMFSGFLRKPRIWPFIFIETAIWLAPFILLVVPLLKRLSTKNPLHAKKVITISWIAVGLTIAIVYKFAYYSSDWSIVEIFRPDITFGWTLPYLIILISFIYLSNDYVFSLSKRAL